TITPLEFSRYPSMGRYRGQWSDGYLRPADTIRSEFYAHQLSAGCGNALRNADHFSTNGTARPDDCGKKRLKTGEKWVKQTKMI
ncbi:MAG: hypothetical protein KKC23_01635, partial [Proteobacteria bacterium]|nr:hypothetical protein [Pseudomonadota bacterium]